MYNINNKYTFNQKYKILCEVSLDKCYVVDNKEKHENFNKQFDEISKKYYMLLEIIYFNIRKKF